MSGSEALVFVDTSRHADVSAVLTATFSMVVEHWRVVDRPTAEPAAVVAPVVDSPADVPTEAATEQDVPVKKAFSTKPVAMTANFGGYAITPVETDGPSCYKSSIGGRKNE